MALDYDLFRKVVAPEFKALSNAELDRFADEAELEISVTKWGKFAPRAVALITAHLIKISENSSAGGSSSLGTGALKRTKVGNLEREWHANGGSNKSDNPYNKTMYGQEYLRLRRKLLISPVFVSC